MQSLSEPIEKEDGHNSRQEVVNRGRSGKFVFNSGYKVKAGERSPRPFSIQKSLILLYFDKGYNFDGW